MADPAASVDRAPETVHLIIRFLGSATLVSIFGVIALAAFKVDAVIVTPVVGLAGTALGSLSSQLSSLRSTPPPQPDGYPNSQVDIDTLPPPPEVPPPWQPPSGTL